MSQRTTLGIAAAITTFLLVLAGGLAGRLSQAGGPEPAAEASAAPQATAIDPALAGLIQEREAAYQAALAEASRRLEEANRQLAAANARPEPAPQGAGYPVSAEQAERLALAAAPGGAVARPAELVSYQGAPAYEVVLDQGTLYIDAQSGAVLGGSLAPPTGATLSAEQAAQVATSYRGGGSVREVEREDEDGQLVFEVQFSDGARIYVDAATGQVVYARAGDGDEGEHAGGEDDD